MVLGKRQKIQRPFDEMRRSTCGNCPSGCGVKVFLSGGKLVDIVGDEEHPTNKGSFCPKGLLTYLHQANPRRIVHPLIRTRRGDPFRRASWSEAIDFVVKRLGQTQESLGRDGCHVHSSATSPFGYLLGATLFAREYGTSYGPWRYQSRALSSEGAIARMMGVAGSRLLMNSPRDWSNSKCIVVYGCDPAATDPMTIGPLIDARERGMEVIVIDTRTTVTATKASYALRVAPGTESVALRGILGLLLENGWVDAQFLREATEGADGLRAELQAFTPERVAQVCGIPAPELRRVAEVIGTSMPVQVISGGWLAPERFDDDDYRLCAALVAFRGSIGIPGGGLNLLNSSPFDCAEWLKSIDRNMGLERISLETALLSNAHEIGSLLLEGDPCARMAGGEDTRDALSKIPLIVALSAYQNSTTFHADAVFPVASWLETEGLLANGNGRALQWHHRVLSPPGDCRSALEFWTDLSSACGFADRLPWSAYPRPQWDRVGAEWALGQSEWTRAVTVDALDPERNAPGGILWPCSEQGQIAFEQSRFSRGDVRGTPNVLFQRNRAFPGFATRFPTHDGRMALFAGNADSPPAPRAGVLALIPASPVDHVDSYSGMVVGRAPGPVQPTLSIHPRTAAGSGVKDGDVVMVENELGAFSGVVNVTDTVSENTIACSVLPWMSLRLGEAPLPSAWALRATGDGNGHPEPYARVKIRIVTTEQRAPLGERIAAGIGNIRLP